MKTSYTPSITFPHIRVLGLFDCMLDYVVDILEQRVIIANISNSTNEERTNIIKNIRERLNDDLLTYEFSEQEAITLYECMIHRFSSFEFEFFAPFLESVKQNIVDKPLRIQRTRKKGEGYLFPEGKRNDLPIVYVGRGSKYGNPFKVGEIAYDNDEEVLTQQEAVDLFEHYAKVLKPEIAEMAKLELKGKNLACWCSHDKPCHADVLLKIANL